MFKYPLQLLKETYAIYYFDSKKFNWNQENIESSYLFVLKEGSCTTIVAKEDVIVDFEDMEKGYRIFCIKGPIPFDDFGVLNSYLSVLANAKISVLVYSTFHNDMILVKEDCLNKVLSLLPCENG